jgi:hypothetical protein
LDASNRWIVVPEEKLRAARISSAIVSIPFVRIMVYITNNSNKRRGRERDEIIDGLQSEDGK